MNRGVKQFLAICWILSGFLVSSCQIPFLEPAGKENQNTLLSVAALSLVSTTIGNCEAGIDLWARNAQNNTSYCVPVDLVTSRAKFEVYRQRGISINYDLFAFANQFEDVIYPKVVAAFGEPIRPNPSKKLAILFLDIQDGARPGASFVAGFFDPVNFYPDSPGSALRSNFRDILYLDAVQLVDTISRDPLAIPATAAHEFQHLIRFPYMVNARAIDDLWINEGTSEVTSDIAGFGPQKLRLDCFRGADRNRCPNGVNNVSMLNWGNTDSATILKQYALAYVYMRYLYDISGSTEAQRNAFFLRSAQGSSDGLRAGFAGTLMRVLSTSPGFNANLLGNSDPETFFRTFTTLMGQASRTTNFSSVTRFVNPCTRSTNSSGQTRNSCATETVDLSPVARAYPLGEMLSELTNANISPIEATVPGGSISTGSIRVFGSQTSLNVVSDAFPNLGNVSGGRSILAWGAYSTSVSNSERSLFTSTSRTKTDAELQSQQLKSLMETVDWKSSPHGVCGHAYLPMDLEHPATSWTTELAPQKAPNE